MAKVIGREEILAGRLYRQGLTQPAATDDEYLKLFVLLQPVSPPFFSYPGSPPCLTHRTTFDDTTIAQNLRARRELVKGRFLNKTLGYVLKNNLHLYANAFARPLQELARAQQRVLETLEFSGPLTPRQLSEETGIRNKYLMPALHRLQEAFLVYEDQVETDWERSWYVFETEWTDVRVLPEHQESAAGEVLLRFLQSHVFATHQQIKNWSGWTHKEVKALLAILEAQKEIIPMTVSGMGEGWLRRDDMGLSTPPAPRTVFMLHKGDPLARSHATELKERYRGLEVLQYLLIDGAFRGAVLGHWRIGPHDVEDIILELPAKERSARKDEIIRAISWGYYPPYSHIRKYNSHEI